MTGSEFGDWVVAGLSAVDRQNLWVVQRVHVLFEYQENAAGEVAGDWTECRFKGLATIRLGEEVRRQKLFESPAWMKEADGQEQVKTAWRLLGQQIRHEFRKMFWSAIVAPPECAECGSAGGYYVKGEAVISCGNEECARWRKDMDAAIRIGPLLLEPAELIRRGSVGVHIKVAVLP